jgi:cell division septum initiation protein DivIVA
MTRPYTEEELAGHRSVDDLRYAYEQLQDRAHEMSDRIDALVEALESAPEPAYGPTNARGPYAESPGREPKDEDYASWYDGTRKEALR